MSETTWDEASRELWFSCDAQGNVRALDERARRALPVAEGQPLSAIWPAENEQRAKAILERARDGAIANVELPVITRNGVGTLSLHARPAEDGGVEALGLLLPDRYGSTVAQLSEAMSEVVSLNREIARQKHELARQRDELAQTNRDLDESTRGVLALHHELREKAEILQRNSDVKSRVVANVSHEFRTPLHTILGLSKLLQNTQSDPLSPEQEKQVRFIRIAAEELYQLINDLLDLSKVEAGKMQLHADTFRADDFLSALRGTMRPLVDDASGVELIIEPPANPIELDTDSSKLGQVLRNLVSNALKFTESGTVRVTTELEPASGSQPPTAIFKVTDTGIGIAPAHHASIFEEFGQIDSERQRKVKGTGLGLPLSRKLAALLGGTLDVESALGKGSTFTLRIPAVHPEVTEMRIISERPLDPTKAPVLVVEDDRKTIFIYENYLAMAGFQIVPARTIEDAQRILHGMRPAAIVLDIMLDGENSWEFLAQVKRNPATADIPVLVVTVTNKESKARALGADEFWLKPLDQDRLLRKLQTLTRTGVESRVLVIDDDEAARYIMRKLLQGTPYVLSEADNGADGVRLARTLRPIVIFLDFLLHESTAFDVLDDLKADPVTRSIPVIIVTSHALDAGERNRLAAQTEAILSKESLSRELAINRIRDALRKAGLGQNKVEP